MSLAVAGTDTGVGKTVVSALILARYGRRKSRRTRLAYWKPVATGGTRDRDASFIESRLGDLAEVLEERYLLERPVSPHLASREEGISIELGELRAAWRLHASDPGRAMVVEGAGGLLVPLNDRGDLLIDLIRALRIPVLLVARTALGTINHTLLSLEALRRRRIEVAGVVMNGPPNRENREAIERFGGVEVIAEVAPMEGRPRPPRSAILRAARLFDAQGMLGRYLTGGRYHEP